MLFFLTLFFSQVTHGAESFFGITDDTEEQKKWTMRRLRYCSRRYGGLKDPQALPEDEATDGASRDVSLGRSVSLDTNRSAAVRRSSTKRDSVAKMAWDGLSTLVKAGCKLPRLRPRVSAVGAQRASSRSFVPAAFVTHTDDEATEQT